MKKLMMSVGIISCLTACGFHLQGTHTTLPTELQHIFIDSSSSPHSAIGPGLTVALKSDGVTCVNNPDQAHITFKILNDQRNTRQIGSGASQETRKYELSESVTFELIDQTGKTIYGPTTVFSSLSHYVYSGQVLGNNQEEGTLYQSLQRNVIQQILFRLNSNGVKLALEQSKNSEKR